MEIDNRMLFIFVPVRKTPGYKIVRTNIIATIIHTLWDFPNNFFTLFFVMLFRLLYKYP